LTTVDTAERMTTMGISRIATSVSLVCVAASCGSSQVIDFAPCRAIWSRSFDAGVFAGLEAMAVTSSDEILLAGYAEGIDFDGATLPSGDGIAFIAKLAPDGTHIWSQYLASPSWVKRVLLAADGAGNALVFGDFEGALDFGGGTFISAGAEDGYVVKLDPAGRHLWSRQLAAPEGQLAGAVAADASGDVFVTGTFRGTIDLGGGPLQSQGYSDVYVAKLDPDGNHLWSKRFGDPDSQSSCWSAAVDPDGNLLLTGRFQRTLDFGGGPIQTVGENGYVAKLDPAGGHLWSHLIDTPDLGEQGLVAADALGDVVVAGGVGAGEAVELVGNTITVAGGSAIFVAKLDAQGGYLWHQLIPYIGPRPWSMAAAPSGVFVAGTSLTAPLAALDASGTLLWVETYLVPGANEERYAVTQSIAVDAAGDAVIGGTFDPALDFGCGLLQSEDGSDIFLAKLRR
jgi:hypothetical protein